MFYDEGIHYLSWKNLEKLHERHIVRKTQGGEHVAQAQGVSTQATWEESENGSKSKCNNMDEDVILSEINQTQTNSV